tara:strand:+ start:396 stop:608 length:213 start_codon:yes stop_codon:yes gene_type:complete
MMVPNMGIHVVFTGGFFMSAQKTKRLVVLLEPELYDEAKSKVDGVEIANLSQMVRIALQRMLRDLSREDT